MRFKSGFLVGLSTGYVLGTKAGQERYQQIVDAASNAAGKLKENPGVQRLTGEVNKTVSVSKDRVAETAAAKADQAKEAVSSVASRVGDNAGSSATTTTTGGSRP